MLSVIYAINIQLSPLLHTQNTSFLIQRPSIGKRINDLTAFLHETTRQICTLN